MQALRLLEKEFGGNSVLDIGTCLIIFLFGFLFRRYGATVLSRQSFKLFKQFSPNQQSDQLVLLIRKPLEQMLTLIILFAALNRLNFPPEWNMEPVDQPGIRWLLKTIWLIAMFVSGSKILLRATDYVTQVISNREESPISKELANFIKELIKVLVIILTFFAGLRFIFNVNITALVASLGIGGLAVALAAQDTLANLLGSFIIYLDKPFRAGDQIEINDIKGKVEHVGFRTTRIRTVEKSLLTVPNKKLIDNALNNITLSAARRVRFVLGLTYGTTSTQIQSIIDEIKKTIHNHPQISDDCTVRFDAFDSSSLNILVVYFVMSNDADVMIEVKEDVNFKIMQIVEQSGSSFAFPSQTIYVKQ